MLESAYEKLFIHQLQSRGWFCYRIETRDRNSSGVPDILALHKSKTFLFELKTGTKIRPEQRLFMLKCKDAYLAQYPDLETVYRLQNNKLEPVLIKELEMLKEEK